MARISRLYNFQRGQIADSEQVDAELNQILTTINGNLDSTNLAAGAFDASKLGNNSVTNIKLAAGIDAAKIGGGTVGNAQFDHLRDVTSPIQAQFNLINGKLSSGDTVKEVDLLASTYRVFSFYVPKLSMSVGAGSQHSLGRVPIYGLAGRRVYLRRFAYLQEGVGASNNNAAFEVYCGTYRGGAATLDAAPNTAITLSGIGYPYFGIRNRGTGGLLQEVLGLSVYIVVESAPA